MKTAIGIIVAVVFLVILLFLLPVFGLFGLLAGTAADVKDNGPQPPPELEAAYRQVAAESNQDWTILAAWDGAGNRFSLPVRPEAEILSELVAQEEQRRQDAADRICQSLPPQAICPPPRELSAADLERLQRQAHRMWYDGVLSYIRGHADQVTPDDLANPEQLFSRVLTADQAARAAELQVGYTVLQELADDDHVEDAPTEGPPADWQSVDGFAWPLTGPITSRYGYRTSPIDGKRRLHTGIDIGVGTGTPIWASKDGVVTRAGPDPVYGLLVVVDHGDGYTSWYAHASELDVAAGARVTQGQLLSRVGQTGLATGPHLHFEIRIQNAPVDPLLLLGR